MAKITDLNRYARERTDKKEWPISEFYLEQLSLLQPIKLCWKRKQLRIEYDAGYPGLHQYFLNDRPRVMRVFGAIRHIRQGEIVDAVISWSPPVIDFVPAGGIIPSILKNLVVTWQTKEPAPADIVVEANALNQAGQYVRYQFSKYIC